jgi:hypothetical protein
MDRPGLFIQFTIAFFRIISTLILSVFIITCQKNPDKPTPAPVETLFNGKDLSGWIGDTTIWKVEQDQLVGSTEEKEIEHAIWITTQEQYDNFELTMQVKLVGDANKNSGVYYRGQWQDDVVVGYEFDIGGWGAEDGEDDENWWGELHDPYRRQDLWIGPGREVIDKTYKEAEWNQLKIRAQDNHIQHWLNGRKMVDWFENDTTIQKSGFIAFQLHDESRCTVYYKDIKLINLNEKTQ